MVNRKVCAAHNCEASTVGKSKYCRQHRMEARQKWLEKVSKQNEDRDNRYSQFAELAKKADAAGKEAAEARIPIPMVVESHKNQLDDSSPVEQSWYVPQGVCGFAWITIRPGNCSFAHWAVKNLNAKKAYGGGVQMCISDYGQCMEKKSAYASAYAKVLKDAGIKAYSGSRMD